MELNEMLQERARVYDSLQRLQNQYNDAPWRAPTRTPTTIWKAVSMN